MYESLVDRLRRLTARHGAHALWVVLFFFLLAVVVAANPVKLLVFAWFGAKSIGAALIGVGLFRTWDKAPEQVPDGIERAMAYTRRITLMAALIVGAALLP